MKKTLLFLLIAATVTIGSVFTLTAKELRGSGRIVTRIVALPAFDKVEASRSTSVILTDNTKPQTVIEADDNLIEYVVVRVENGKLTVGIDPEIQSISNPHIRVIVPTDGVINELEAGSAAEISGSVVLIGPKLELEASSAGRIEITAKVTKCKAEATSAAKIAADVQASECEAETSSGASIKLSGKTERGEFAASSGSRIKALDLTATNCEAKVSSGSRITLSCTGHLNAHASSGGSIAYKGDCQINKNANSGGSIRKH